MSNSGKVAGGFNGIVVISGGVFGNLLRRHAVRLRLRRRCNGSQRRRARRRIGWHGKRHSCQQQRSGPVPSVSRSSTRKW
jgi:hypothetical protein